MEFEQQLRAAFAPTDPRPDLRARILARRATLRNADEGKRRPGIRTVLFGTVLAVAAAAAILMPKFVENPHSQLVKESPMVAPARELVATTAPDPELVAEATAEPSTKIALPTDIVPSVATFTVRLLPLQNESTDPLGKAAIDALHTVFVNELRAVAGVALILSDSDDPDDELVPDIQITLQGGGSAADNKFDIAVLGHRKDVLKMRQKIPKEQRTKTSGYNFIVADRGDILAACVGSQNGDGKECKSPTAVAASLVDRLRNQVFPEDSFLTSRLRNRLLDASLEPLQRLKALTDMGTFRDEAIQDPSVVRGAIALATSATDPAIRAQVWRAMRGSGRPELAHPLTAALLQERDGEVRRQIVMLLQADFQADPAAREALKIVAREETQPFVRALAKRALMGEAFWQDYFVSSLKDTSLSESERMEAFLYQVATPWRTPGSFRYSSANSIEALDDEAMAALTTLLPAVAKYPEGKPSMGSVVSRLGALRKPAVTPMLVGMLDQVSEPALRHSIIKELSRRAGDPSVKAVLEKVSKEDPDAAIRDLAATALNDLPVGGVN